jgi:hypothetical protein
MPPDLDRHTEARSYRGIDYLVTKSRFVLMNPLARADDGAVMPAARDFSPVRHTVETLTAEIGRIVVERQDLRAAGAPAGELEENRRRLAAAQSALSRLLIERHLPAARTA